MRAKSSASFQAQKRNNISLNDVIAVVKAMTLGKLPADADLSAVCKCIQEHKEPCSMLYRLYATAVVIAASLLRACESSFFYLVRHAHPCPQINAAFKENTFSHLSTQENHDRKSGHESEMSFRTCRG